MTRREPLPPPVVAHLCKRGVSTRGELLALGCTDNDLRRWVRTGLLSRLRNGIYSHDVQGSLIPMLRGAVLAGPDVVVSHRAGTRLHGLPVWSHVMPEVTRHVRGPRIRGVVVHRYGVHPDHVVILDDLPTTSLARTLVDVCRVLDEPRALVTLDAALARDGGLRDEALDVVAQLGDINFARRARQCLMWADGGAESPLESFARGQLLMQGLPAPWLQWWVGDGRDTWFRPDKLWVEWGLIGEADGRGKYETSDTLLAEKARQEWFEDRDFAFVRYGSERITRDPAAVALRWRELRDRQTRLGWRWPAGVWLVEPGPWPPSRRRVVNKASAPPRPPTLPPGS